MHHDLSSGAVGRRVAVPPHRDAGLRPRTATPDRDPHRDAGQRPRTATLDRECPAAINKGSWISLPIKRGPSR
jgi:hypothetical protein